MATHFTMIGVDSALGDFVRALSVSDAIVELAFLAIAMLSLRAGCGCSKGIEIEDHVGDHPGPGATRTHQEPAATET